tara:strand:- start:2666 stop:2875 length:210 start_codon:yes stop_codon:yes gene_type:complete
MSTHEHATDILKWADRINAEKGSFNFDTDFITSVLEKYKKYEKFTDKQASAIDNIYTRFKVADYLVASN